MKCSSCQKDVAGMRSICPNCQNPLLSIHKETISDAREGASDSEPKRSSLLSIVRIAGLAVALIGLTTIARLNYVSGGRPQPSPTKDSPGSLNRLVSTPQPVNIAGGNTNPGSASLVTRLEEKAAKESDPQGAAQVKAAVVANRLEKKLPGNSAELSDRETRRNELKEAKEQTVAVNSVARSTAPQPEATVEAEPAAEISLEPPDKSLDQHTGLLTLNSYVRARIYIDGQYSGTTPRTVRLVSGEHTILLLADGYEEWTRKIRLNGRQQTGLMASMNKK